MGTRSRPRARGLIALGGLLLLCGLPGGCGGGASSTGSHATGAPRHAGVKTPLTRSRAVAFARAVNLRSADVPGFTPSSKREGEGAREKQLQSRLRQCVGSLSFGGPLAAAQSPSFRLRRTILDLGVNSEVAVAPTPELAARELAAIRGARIRQCFSHYLDLLLEGQRKPGARLRPVSIASGTPPAPGANGSFGWRITATFAVGRIPVSLYVDILGFILGPARVTLVSSGALRPFPAAIQQRLYALLLSRAGARAL
jgi:hypothetical protein